MRNVTSNRRHRRANRYLTPKQIQSLIARYLAGASQTAAGKPYGLSQAGVSYLLKREGVKARDPWWRPAKVRA